MNLEEIQSFYDFTDRVVLVSGGTGVLGLGIVHSPVECNANAVILSRHRERAANSVATWSKNLTSKGCVLGVRGDVLAIDSLQRANQTVQAEFGRLVEFNACMKHI